MEKFDYQKICLDIIRGLPPRTADVIKRRFGLFNSFEIKKGKGGDLNPGNRETLEAIGKSYGITRERVRQIEEEGFSKISPEIKKQKKLFQYFRKTLISFGGLKQEKALLQFLGGERFQNHILFLLTNSEEFIRVSENDDFYSFWAVEKKITERAKRVVNLIVKKLEKIKKSLSLEEFFRLQNNELSKILNKKIKKQAFLSFIEISKKIQKNHEGRFGLKNWIEINPRGVKDKAYLVLKKEEKPLHFAQVASLIERFPFPSRKKVHTATVHNELIKDPRFVLVGRGLYALREWGYEPGIVRDIIYKILKESKKPLQKDEILKKVLKQRFVKENTVFINLQDKNYFLKDSWGRYTIKEV